MKCYNSMIPLRFPQQSEISLTLIYLKKTVQHSNSNISFSNCTIHLFKIKYRILT